MIDFLDLNDENDLELAHRVLFFNESEVLDAENSDESDKDFVECGWDNCNESDTSDAEDPIFLDTYYIRKGNVKKWIKLIERKKVRKHAVYKMWN